MKRTPIPTFPCPYCGDIIYALTNVTGQKLLPADGDAGMCSSCRKVHIFVQTAFGLTTRRLRPDEAWKLEHPIVAEGHRILDEEERDS